MARSLKIRWPARSPVKSEGTYEYKAEENPNTEKEKTLLWFCSLNLRKGNTLTVWKREEVSRSPKSHVEAESCATAVISPLGELGGQDF